MLSREEQGDVLLTSVQQPASASPSATSAMLIPNGLSSRKEGCRKAIVALIDEFPLRRASTLNLLRGEIRVGAQPFSGAAELLAQVSQQTERPCCVIMSVGWHSVTESSLAEQLRQVRRALEPAPIIVLSDREEPDEIVAAFREGARGYIPTSLDPRLVIEAIRMVLAGGTFAPADALIRSRRNVQPLMDRPAKQVAVEHKQDWPSRQLGVLRLLIEGKANKEIARALTMEESTVKVHVRHIMRRLGVGNRTQAAVVARRLGIEASIDFARPCLAPDVINPA